MNPPDSSVYVVGSKQIQPNNPAKTLGSQIPVFDDLRKTEYLKYRACWFSLEEACALSKVSEKSVLEWLDEDDEFFFWEHQGIAVLQANASVGVIWGQFMRNATMVMKGDGALLWEYAKDPTKVPPNAEMLRDATKRYSANAIGALARIIGGPNNSPDEVKPGVLELRVQVDLQDVSDHKAREAAAEMLLEQLTRKPEIIEGEFTRG